MKSHAYREVLMNDDDPLTTTIVPGHAPSPSLTIAGVEEVLECELHKGGVGLLLLYGTSGAVCYEQRFP